MSQLAAVPSVPQAAETGRPAGSAGRWLRPSLDRFPRGFPREKGYLRADAARVSHWRGRLDGLGVGLKVGICWRSGNTAGLRRLDCTELGDWGAVLAWHAALLRPNLFRALVLMSVPYVPRRKMSQSQWEAEKYPGRIFYQADLRSPLAEAFFESDIRTRLLRGLWLLSGDAPPDKRWHPARDPDAPPAAPALPARLPRWLTEADLDFLEGEYRRTGFSGGLNYYRNCDRNWELTPFLEGAPLPQPTLFLAGEKDPVLDFLGEEFAALQNHVPNLWKKALIPRAGHWIQQERPEDVNLLLIDFLHELERSASQLAASVTK